MKLTGNTILITGGGTGIGRGLAIRFQEMGNQVIICGRREEKLKETAMSCPGIRYKVCDISSEADRRSLFAYVSESFPQMNVLINNAAIQTDYDLSEGADGLANLDKEVAINLLAPIKLNGLFIPFLKKQTDPVIIDVTSILGFTPLTRCPIYCSAKAGFHVYTMELRKHLEKDGIEVYEVPPCRVETDLNPTGRANARPGTEKVGLQVEEYVQFVMEELEKGNLDIFYGQAGEEIRTLPRPVTELSRLN